MARPRGTHRPRASRRLAKFPTRPGLEPGIKGPKPFVLPITPPGSGAAGPAARRRCRPGKKRVSRRGSVLRPERAAATWLAHFPTRLSLIVSDKLLRERPGGRKTSCERITLSAIRKAVNAIWRGKLKGKIGGKSAGKNGEEWGRRRKSPPIRRVQTSRL